MNQASCFKGLLVALVGALSGASAVGQEIAKTYLSPSLDRWMYIYNGAFPGGSEEEARLFAPWSEFTLTDPQPSPSFEDDFDNRDGTMLIGFNTGADVPVGQGTGRYRILSATVTAWISRQELFAYDPTQDAVSSYYTPSDAARTVDGDAGRPIEMHLVGYRAPFSLLTFGEASPYYNGAPFPQPPVVRNKNAFSAQYNPAGSGTVLEVSNNVFDRFESRPLAIGQMPLSAGALVPQNTPVTFAVDLLNPDARVYLRNCLNAGRLTVMLSSIYPTEQQSVVVPAFYTKESPVAMATGRTPSLNLRVCVGAATDWDCDGDVDLEDLLSYFDAWTPRGAETEFNGSGEVDLADLLDFFDLWTSERDS